MASRDVSFFLRFFDSGYLLYFAITALTLWLFALKSKRAQSDKTPPCYSGWIPWLGCAVEFGKAPLSFIEESRRKFGSIFTLKVAGKRLTFLMDPSDYAFFFHSLNVDFQQVVQQPVAKTGDIPASVFFEFHTQVHDCVKGRLAPAYLAPFCINLSMKFAENIKAWGQNGVGELNQLVRSSMYKAVVENLFGENILPTSPEKAFLELQHHFIKYDEGFEYASQLPAVFCILKDWRASKKYLLDMFRKIVPKVITDVAPGQETLLQTLVKTINGPYAPNFGLLMMWASLANAIPITFWTLAFIYEHPTELNKIKKEVKAVMNTKVTQDLLLTEQDLVKMPCVKRAILETIRLRAPGVITRGVKSTFNIKNYTIPKGDHLILSPYWMHRNPTYFPDPERFHPDRWLNADLEKNLFLEGFIGFGGGRYQCPGRWFALMEMQVYIALVIHLMEVHLVDTVPRHSHLHIVGTQQPDGPCQVEFTSIN